LLGRKGRLLKSRRKLRRVEGAKGRKPGKGREKGKTTANTRKRRQ
jgi:hypothetical protein